MGSGGSKKLRPISMSSTKSPAGLPHRKYASVPSNLGSLKKSSSIGCNIQQFSHTCLSMLESDFLPVECQLNTSNTRPELSEMTNSKMLHQHIPSRVDADGILVAEESFWTVTELYNVLTAESWLGKPQIHSATYVLLLDCRSQDAYEQNHVITAKHHSCLHLELGHFLHIPGELESFNMIVIYEDSDGSVAEKLRTRNVPFYELHSKFALFERKYPFLCTSKSISLPSQREKHLKTWPSEVLEQKLYQGAAIHVSDEEILKSLGITHIVNVTLNCPNHFPDRIKYMSIRLDDELSVDLMSWLPKTSKFIADAIGDAKNLDKGKNNRVLVHCNLGRSRSSTVVLGYLMEILNWSLQDASDWLKDCRPVAKPNIGFLNQLMTFEKKVFGHQLSDFNSLPF